jgi:dihydroorotate dehydrogenase (NAD+) catalytic subunit
MLENNRTAAQALAWAGPSAEAVDLSLDLAGLRLPHPILNGSGTFDALAALRAFGPELFERFPFAAFVTKTITPEPRAGNPTPRLWETAAGMVNSIGLPNKGLRGFLAEDLPGLAELPVPLVVSVAGFTHADFARLVETVAAQDEVAAIELNVSCPNVESGCVIGSDPSETLSLLRIVRPLTSKPLIVKLTPNVSDAGAVAEAGVVGGADAVSLVNTFKAMPIDEHGAPALGAGSGGLSGPAIKPAALALVHEVASRVSVPVIGMGGVQSGRDALDFVAVGATCVAVGTENFRDPAAGIRIREELRALLAKRKFRTPPGERPSTSGSGDTRELPANASHF